MGTKGTTKDALEAEERVEYADALQLYKEVRGGGGGGGLDFSAMQRDEGGGGIVVSCPSCHIYSRTPCERP